MLCIQEELEQMNIQPNNSPEGLQLNRQQTTPEDSDSSPACSQNPINSKQQGWINGIFGCLRPVLSIIGKAGTNEIKGNQQGTYYSHKNKMHCLNYFSYYR